MPEIPLRRPRPRATTAAVMATVAAVVAATAFVSARPAAAAPVESPPAVSRPSTGYWLAAADGGVFTYGDAQFGGSAGDLRLDRPVVGMAAPATGAGYWLVAADGGIFAYGNVGFFGSTGDRRLNQPIVGMTPTPSGRGYWLVAADGGIFAFGDADFLGSAGGMALNQPIVAMASTPTGRGYWLAARDGGIFTFGDAAFFGSTGAMKLNQPIVTMAPTPSGAGYWLAAADGGMFTFGDAGFFGSTGAMKLNKAVVGMAPTGVGTGYWLVASDGGIFSFGETAFYGSAGGGPLNSPIVAMVPRSKPGRVGAAAFYYPWYGDAGDDSAWFHWRNNGANPPTDVASNFFPVRGAYSSNDTVVLQQQMAELRAAGIDTVVVSWWGLGSYEDRALPRVVAAARQQGLRVAIHEEPYSGRTPDSVQRDVLTLLDRHAIDEYWIYQSDGPPPEAWHALTSRFPNLTFWAQGHSAANGVRGVFQSYAAKAGFDGVYTYDPVGYAFGDFKAFCGQARTRGLACSPSVSPGYDGRRGVPDPTTRDRAGGGRYDDAWTGAFAAGADVITVTSYNEWHEGTQIEPARAGTCIPSYCYLSYEGAYGSTGGAAEAAYLDRTRFWTDALGP